MATYVPITREEEQSMLEACGLQQMDDLYRDVPESVRLRTPLNIPSGMAEKDVRREMERLAGENTVFPHVFRGAGSYRHMIPAIVDTVTGHESFRTAYTPYQAEISQGVLQSIFEFQTDICELTGMEAANASVYDGACAAAEACEMCRDKKRSRILVSESVDPKVLSVIRTYAFGRDTQVDLVPARGGVTDPESLANLLQPDVSCLVVQQPNYFGCIEKLDILTEVIHGAGARMIVHCNPIALALLKTPGEYGADIAVGEGQPLGIPLSWGGPYLGFMATTSRLMRHLPGRIVGETTDAEGNRAFVLTLQAREQHIRREKASSNICSNEALCAARAAAYLAAMGPGGLRQAAEQCAAKAHYLQRELEKAGLAPVFPEQAFFHEFVTECPDADRLLSALRAEGILGGLPLDGNRMLWCATEMNTREEMDRVAAVVREVFAS